MGSNLFHLLNVDYTVNGLLEYLYYSSLSIHGNLTRPFLIVFKSTSQITTLSTCLH